MGSCVRGVLALVVKQDIPCKYCESTKEKHVVHYDASTDSLGLKCNDCNKVMWIVPGGNM